MESFPGSCLCGQVTVQVSCEPLAAAICHCRTCRKQSGSAFSFVATFPEAGVDIVGETREFVTTNDAGDPVRRCFCPTCGTPVATSSAATQAQGVIVLKAPLFDGASGLLAAAPQLQLYCEDALPWVPDIPGSVHFGRMPG